MICRLRLFPEQRCEVRTNGFEAGTGTRVAQGCQLASCPNLKPISPLIQLIAEDPVFPASDSVSFVPLSFPCHSHFMALGGWVFQAQELRSQSVGSVCTAKSPLAASRDCPLSALVLQTVSRGPERASHHNAVVGVGVRGVWESHSYLSVLGEMRL